MTSYRHHYIPRFYIKEFTSRGDKLFIYDKQTKLIWKNPASPKQIFFEMNRNLLKLNNKDSDHIEKDYIEIENLILPHYKKIVSQNGHANYEIQDILYLRLLSGLTYWRIPINDTEIEKHISKLSFEELFLGNVLQEPKNEQQFESLRTFINSPNFIKSNKIILPLLESIKLNSFDDLDNWKLLYSKTPHFSVISDNPVILRTQCSINNFYETEQLFPLSKETKLIFIKGSKVKEIRKETLRQIDQLHMVQAYRYIGSNNKEYLKFLINFYEEYNMLSESAKDLFRERVFKSFVE